MPFGHHRARALAKYDQEHRKQQCQKAKWHRRNATWRQRWGLLTHEQFLEVVRFLSRRYNRRPLDLFVSLGNEMFGPTCCDECSRMVSSVTIRKELTRNQIGVGEAVH